MDPSNRIAITIIGDGGCGKSSITLRLVRSQWTSEYDPTIEDSYSVTRSVDGQTYHLALTDTAGQEEYRGMWGGGGSLRADAFLLVYDITSRATLEALDEFNALVDMVAETRFEEHANARAKTTTLRGAGGPSTMVTMPVKIVAGNKCDLQQSRQVDAKTGLEWARSRGCGFMETSARNTVNIEETFALLVRRVVEARQRALSPLPPAGAPQPALPSGAVRRGSSPPGLPLDAAGLGTRRAVTAPLSPLLQPADEKGRGRRWGWGWGWRRLRFWSRMRCWSSQG
ncbi:MAG: hypothetical protein M1818_000668 [Claussenomyces sp. TS43310]|nr:MAG: hypothetical protein M1818_000668 [Claussenomyces sp. TS43310]